MEPRPLVPRRSPLRDFDSPRNSGPSHIEPRHHSLRQMSIDSSQSFAWSGASELSASTTASSFTGGPHKVSPWASPIDATRPSLDFDEDMRDDGGWQGLPDSPIVEEDIDAHLNRLTDFFPDRPRWSAADDEEHLHTASRPETADGMDELLPALASPACVPSGPRFSWLDLPPEPAASREGHPHDASPTLTIRPSSGDPDNLQPSTARASQLARQAVAAASKLSQDRRTPSSIGPAPPSASSYFDHPVTHGEAATPAAAEAPSTPGVTFLRPPASPTMPLSLASRRGSATSVYSTASYATTSAHAPAPTLEPVPALPTLDKRSSWWSDMLSVPSSPALPSPTRTTVRAGASKTGGRRRSRISMQRTSSSQRTSWRAAPPSPRSPRTPVPRFTLPESPTEVPGEEAEEDEGLASALAKLAGDMPTPPAVERALPSLPPSSRPSPRASTVSPSRASKRASSRSSIIFDKASKRLSVAPTLPNDILPPASRRSSVVLGAGAIEKKQLPRRPRPRLGRRVLQSQFNGGFFASHCRTWDIVTEEIVPVEPPKPRLPRISRAAPAPSSAKSTTPTSAHLARSTSYKRISTPLDDPNQPSLYELYSREGQKKRADADDEKPLAALSPHGIRAPLTADTLGKQLTPGSAGPRSALSAGGFPFAGSYMSIPGARAHVAPASYVAIPGAKSTMSVRAMASPGAPPLPFPSFPFGAPPLPPGMQPFAMSPPASMASYAPLRSDMTLGTRGPASSMSTSPRGALATPTSARRSPAKSLPPMLAPPAPRSTLSVPSQQQQQQQQHRQSQSMSSRPHRGVNPELKIDTARAAAQQRERLRAEALRTQAAHPTPRAPQVSHVAQRSDGSQRSMAAVVEPASAPAVVAEVAETPKSGRWGFFKRTKSVSGKEAAKLARKSGGGR